MAEQELAVPGAEELGDANRQWEALDSGLKSRAMRAVYEDQQKLVVDLGRTIMEKQTAIAIAVARLKAVSDLDRGDQKQAIIETELVPLHKELAEIQVRIKEERELLDTYEKLGKGIISS